MSVVYEAENPRLGSAVALKVLAPELAADDVFRARFLKESRIAASLNHPNVIPVYDVGSSGALLYIAMRYVAGADLRGVLRERHRLSPAEALPVIGQAARALDAAHRHGLVHRDVKPGNFLIEHGTDDDPDHVYLTDFGIAKHLTSRSGLTATGEFLGTIDYLAPEQIRGQHVDSRTDVYALGCVLYECLTGHVPFVKDVDAAVIWAHVEETPAPPSAVRPGLPAPDTVIARALAKQPGDRYQSCRELVSAARAALGNPSAQPHTITAARSGPAAPPPDLPGGGRRSRRSVSGRQPRTAHRQHGSTGTAVRVSSRLPPSSPCSSRGAPAGQPSTAVLHRPARVPLRCRPLPHGRACGTAADARAHRHEPGHPRASAPCPVPGAWSRAGELLESALRH